MICCDFCGKKIIDKGKSPYKRDIRVWEDVPVAGLLQEGVVYSATLCLSCSKQEIMHLKQQEVSDMGKNTRGKQDGTGPYKGSPRPSVKKGGLKKGKCK